ncbi:hypothetical protein [Actinokineospora sp.]|uniref:hypothetical protein n=1 Tax=Actinokineospora sp. TaxID=1872133 RepID=UPI004037FB48
MTVDPVVLRLSDAGFSVVPILNMHGGYTGLLAWRRDVLDLVIVTAWSDDSAFGGRVPRGRDWSRPFAPTIGVRYGPAPFAEVADRLLRPRHGLVVEPEGLDSAPFAEGAR